MALILCPSLHSVLYFDTSFLLLYLIITREIDTAMRSCVLIFTFLLSDKKLKALWESFPKISLLAEDVAWCYSSGAK